MIVPPANADEQNVTESVAAAIDIAQTHFPESTPVKRISWVMIKPRHDIRILIGTAAVVVVVNNICIQDSLINDYFPVLYCLRPMPMNELGVSHLHS